MRLTTYMLPLYPIIPTSPTLTFAGTMPQKPLLYQGHAAQIASMLTQRAHKLPAQAHSLLSHATYFENNQRRMNYMQNREDDLLIGSGAVESEAKQFKARFCGPGMRWSRVGLNHLLPIRAAVMQDSFDADWNSVYHPS
jgi:hypothetical protein